MHRYSKPASLSLCFLLLLGWSQFAKAQETAAFDLLIPRDNYQLRGQLFEAHGEGPFPIAILLQGIPGGERDVLGLGERLSEAGIHALTFNYSGTYSSGGLWNPLANDEADVRAVLDYVHRSDPADRYNIDTTRVYLGGYSHGGGVALVYAARHPEVHHVFSIAGNDFGAFGRSALANPALVKAVDELFAGYFARGWLHPAADSQPQWDFLDHLDEVDVRRHAPLLVSKQVFLAGGLDDNITPIEDHMVPVYRALKRAGAAQVHATLYQTDHSFREARDQIAAALIDWIRAQE